MASLTNPFDEKQRDRANQAKQIGDIAASLEEQGLRAEAERLESSQRDVENAPLRQQLNVSQGAQFGRIRGKVASASPGTESNLALLNSRLQLAKEGFSGSQITSSPVAISQTGPFRVVRFPQQFGGGLFGGINFFGAVNNENILTPQNLEQLNAGIDPFQVTPAGRSPTFSLNLNRAQQSAGSRESKTFDPRFSRAAVNRDVLSESRRLADLNKTISAFV